MRVLALMALYLVLAVAVGAARSQLQHAQSAPTAATEISAVGTAG